jgi:hypothetical protein
LYINENCGINLNLKRWEGHLCPCSLGTPGNGLGLCWCREIIKFEILHIIKGAQASKPLFSLVGI